MIALVVAIAGIMFPAISVDRSNYEGTEKTEEVPVAPFTSQRLLPGIPYAAERKFAAAVTKSSVSSSSLSNDMISSLPVIRRSARRSVL